MLILYYIIIFVFGSVIGSFLNVVINRYNTGISLGGRSMCFLCGETLKWYELAPIISFLAQAGKCRECGGRISLQYPLVELLTGILFLFTIYKLQFTNYFDVSTVIYIWIISSILVGITVYDLKHKIIPNGFVYSFVGLSFVYLIADLAFGIGEFSAIDLFAGPALAAPFALLWLLSRGEWMGLGDAKLALGIGWFLGMYPGLSAIVLAFWIGALSGIFLVALSKTGLFLAGKKLTIKSEIPFGPFLILALFLVLFFKIDALNLII